MPTAASSCAEAAAAFCAARRAGRGLAAWPGAFPATLEEAYALQRACIDGWGDAVAGWKVGRITGADAARHGAERFIGPIFAGTVAMAAPGAVFRAIAGGTALVECELVAVLGRDAREAGGDLAALVGEWRIAIEVAGSPLAAIDTLGPLASVACFGNNNGVLLGPPIAGWRARALGALGCATYIDGALVGRDTARRLPGGPWAGLAFALAEAGRRGVALARGAIIATGAITGMHPVTPGAQVRADFGALGTLACRVVAG